jgi:hypothetical protein
MTDLPMSDSIPPRHKWAEARDQAIRNPGMFILVSEDEDGIKVWNEAKSAAGGRAMKTRYKYGNGISAHRRMVEVPGGVMFRGYIRYSPTDKTGGAE